MRDSNNKKFTPRFSFPQKRSRFTPIKSLLTNTRKKLNLSSISNNSMENQPLKLPPINKFDHKKRAKLDRSFTYQNVPEKLMPADSPKNENKINTPKFNGKSLLSIPYTETIAIMHCINLIIRNVKQRISDILLLGTLINFKENTLRTAIQLTEDQILKIINREGMRKTMENIQISLLEYRNFVDDKNLKKYFF